MTQRGKGPRPGLKKRADQLLFERGLAPSRSQAQALVLAGELRANGRPVSKPGDLLDQNSLLEVLEHPRFVSRGGQKLEGSLSHFALDVAGWVCVDIGASTGGFTDCLLQRGARRIYAVDVGRGQLAEKLRVDPRVVVMDRTNARHLVPGAFPEPLDFAVLDASFIGIAKLMPAVSKILPPGRMLLALIKPQFEAGRHETARGKGVIRDAAVRAEAIERATRSVLDAGFSVLGSCDSALPGPKGNAEHFVLARRSAP